MKEAWLYLFPSTKKPPQVLAGLFCAAQSGKRLSPSISGGLGSPIRWSTVGAMYNTL